MAEHTYALVPVATGGQWSAFHAIRRTVLFDGRQFGPYDPDHPDDRSPQNHPVLLTCDDMPVAAMRIDMVPQQAIAIMRTVAVAEDEQRQGHGRTMLSLAEGFAVENGCVATVVFSAEDAVGFYAKCGYELQTWDPADSFGSGTQMRKPLAKVHPNLYEETAALYDLGNERPSIAADIPFYLEIIAPTESVLEVGCGTGRVALELAERGNLVTGIDLSPSMLKEFCYKIAGRPSVSRRLTLGQMDMRDFDLGRAFDWIIFPFRVFQALTSDEDRRLCLASARRHMHEGSRAVVTLFNPDRSILEGWGRKDVLDFESTDEATGRTVRRFQDQLWHDSERQIIAATTRYQVHDGDAVLETLVDELELGYLYPDQCEFALCRLRPGRRGCLR